MVRNIFAATLGRVKKDVYGYKRKSCKRLPRHNDIRRGKHTKRPFRALYRQTLRRRLVSICIPISQLRRRHRPLAHIRPRRLSRQHKSIHYAAVPAIALDAWRLDIYHYIEYLLAGGTGYSVQIYYNNKYGGWGNCPIKR